MHAESGYLTPEHHRQREVQLYRNPVWRSYLSSYLELRQQLRQVRCMIAAVPNLTAPRTTEEGIRLSSAPKSTAAAKWRSRHVSRFQSQARRLAKAIKAVREKMGPPFYVWKRRTIPRVRKAEIQKYSLKCLAE